jgi:hypothetical protein
MNSPLKNSIKFQNDEPIKKFLEKKEEKNSNSLLYHTFYQQLKH